LSANSTLPERASTAIAPRYGARGAVAGIGFGCSGGGGAFFATGGFFAWTVGDGDFFADSATGFFAGGVAGFFTGATEVFFVGAATGFFTSAGPLINGPFLTGGTAAIAHPIIIATIISDLFTAILFSSTRNFHLSPFTFHPSPFTYA